MSRTVLALVAVGAVIIAAALGYAWRAKMNDQAAIEAVKPAATVSPVAAASTTPPPAPTDSKPPVASAPAAPVPAPSVAMPSFDVARIGPDGRAVIGVERFAVHLVGNQDLGRRIGCVHERQ